MTDAWSYFLEFKGEQFELDGDDLTVGRSRTCDVSIKDPSVSRRHVCLGTSGGTIRLTDLGSSNGTFINGAKIEGEGELGDGDTLGLGDADVQVRITAKAGFETIRMPRLPDGEGQIPQVGEATSILQKASMQLAKETLGDDLEESGGPAPAPTLPPATFAGPPRTAPPRSALPVDEPPTAAIEPPTAAFEPPPAGEETSFAGLGDELPDFGSLGSTDEPSFAPPDDGPDFGAPDFSMLDEEPEAPQSAPPPISRATIELPSTPTPGTDFADAGTPEVESVDVAPPELPRLELPEPAPKAPEVQSPPQAPAPQPPPKAPSAVPPATPLLRGPASMAEPESAGERTDVRLPVPPAAEAEAKPERSSDELLPSLDGFDTTLGPGTPIPESMLRAQESMAKVRSETQEPLPKLYEKPIQVPPMAGFGVRLMATLLDDVWMLALGAGAWLSLQELGAGAAVAVSLLVILAGWAIWGTTPGKRLLGLYVCTEDGQAGLGLARAALRLFGYLVSAVPLGLGFLMVLSSSKRGLHDRIAGTYVRRFK